MKEDVWLGLSRQIVSQPPDLLVYDFGGTLMDFLPLHVSAFYRAVGDENVPFATVSDLVSSVAQLGADSFSMAGAVVDGLGLAVPRQELATRKRRNVEEMLKEVTLGPDAIALLRTTAALTQIAVISRGMVSSMHAVLLRSLGSEAAAIALHGRQTVDGRVNKADLLSSALADAGVASRHARYVGDAEVDLQVAQAVGCPFTRFAPFDQPENETEG